MQQHHTGGIQHTFLQCGLFFRLLSGKQECQNERAQRSSHSRSFLPTSQTQRQGKPKSIQYIMYIEHVEPWNPSNSWESRARSQHSLQASQTEPWYQCQEEGSAWNAWLMMSQSRNPKS